MSDSVHSKSLGQTRSFFSFAAWYSFAVPISAVLMTLTLVVISERTSILPTEARDFISRNLSAFAFWVYLSSFVLGIFSLFGIGRHGPAFILWKAVPGIFASGLLGFVHLSFVAMAHC